VSQVFISYSRQDKGFVRQLGDALAAQKREAWVDWKDIPLTAEWQQEIFTNIEAADNFIFIISPDSVASLNCGREIDHARANNKRMVPVFYRAVPDNDIPENLGKFQRIDFGDKDDFDSQFKALTTALDTDLAWVQMHTRLLTRAKEWERRGKDSSLLLRGKDLIESEEWLRKRAKGDVAPTALHSQYILASRRAATRRRRIAFGAALIAVGVAVFLFLRSNVVQRGARQAKGRELATAAAESLDQEPERSILLAMYAVNATLQFGQPPVPAAEEELHQALLSSEVRFTLRGHSGGVISVVYSPDGKRIATASMDKTVKVWDAATGKELLTLRGHSDTVKDVAFSPDGRRIATVSDDKTAKVWDSDTGKELLTLQGHSDIVVGVTYSPDGRRLVTASWDKTARVWDAASGQLLRTLSGTKDAVLGVAFGADGKRIATANNDTTVKLWDASSGQLLRTLRGHSSGVTCVAFSPDGKQLASGSFEDMAKLWDVRSGRKLRTLGGDRSVVERVAFSPDGKVLAIASGHTAYLLETASGKELWSYSTHNSQVTGELVGVTISPDNSHLTIGIMDNTAKILEPGSGPESPTLGDVQPSASISEVAFSPDGKRVAAIIDYKAKVFDAVSGDPLWSLPADSGNIFALAFSPDGKRLSSANDSTATLWDAGTGQSLLVMPKSHSDIMAVAFSLDGRRLATASNDETAKVWDPLNGKLLLTLQGHSSYVHGVAFSPDGKRLATASNDNTAMVWDAINGEHLLTLAGHTDILTGVAFSPDGKRIVTASWDETVRVWNATTGTVLLTIRIPGTVRAVRGVAFSADGKRLAIAGEDATTTLWDSSSGHKLQVLPGAVAADGIAYSRDGKRVATAQANGAVMIYALDIRELLGVAHQRVTRNLTRAECQRYFQSETCPPLP
jgi:WD40 repeat protein